MRWLGPIAAAALVAACCEAVAQESGAPPDPEDRTLRLRVTPGGYTKGPETIEEKLARRMRSMDHQFRLICRGCLSAAAEDALERLPDPNAKQVPVDEEPRTAPRESVSAADPVAPDPVVPAPD